jgi:hypothetical protein
MGQLLQANGLGTYVGGMARSLSRHGNGDAFSTSAGTLSLGWLEWWCHVFAGAWRIGLLVSFGRAFSRLEPCRDVLPIWLYIPATFDS